MLLYFYQSIPLLKGFSPSFHIISFKKLQTYKNKATYNIIKEMGEMSIKTGAKKYAACIFISVF